MRVIFTINSQSSSFCSRVLVFAGGHRNPCPHILAIFLCPCHGFGKLFLIIDTFSHATDNFGQIYRFATDAQIFLEEIRIHNRTGNTHGYTTHRQIRFSAHGRLELPVWLRAKTQAVFPGNVGRIWQAWSSGDYCTVTSDIKRLAKQQVILFVHVQARPTVLEADCGPSTLNTVPKSACTNPV